jgi:hypothetical protein
MNGLIACPACLYAHQQVFVCWEEFGCIVGCLRFCNDVTVRDCPVEPPRTSTEPDRRMGTELGVNGAPAEDRASLTRVPAPVRLHHLAQQPRLRRTPPPHRRPGKRSLMRHWVPVSSPASPARRKVDDRQRLFRGREHRGHRDSSGAAYPDMWTPSSGKWPGRYFMGGNLTGDLSVAGYGSQMEVFGRDSSGATYSDMYSRVLVNGPAGRTWTVTWPVTRWLSGMTPASTVIRWRFTGWRSMAS